MKIHQFKILPGVGPVEIDQTGTLFDLLNAIPYLFNKNRLPPVVVINSILKTGHQDAGMSGGVRWPPFSITHEEFMELSDHCRQQGMQICDPPAWVTNQRLFQI